MENSIDRNDISDTDDVKSAQQGNYESLEKLICKYQSFIYNIALRMTGNIQDAEDITQEILIKMVTKLSTFQGNSGFRTWLYKIIVNHVLNMKRKQYEKMFLSFDQHKEFINNINDMGRSDTFGSDPEERVLVEETKMMCMMGMLLCFNREQRLIFILGSAYGVNSSVGGDIMDISPELFRKKLSRARKQLREYMNGNCSLLNENAHCKCSRKVTAAISAGYIDPKNLKFAPDYVQKATNFACDNLYNENSNMSVEALFKQQPYLESPDYTKLLHIINTFESDIKSIQNLDP